MAEISWQVSGTPANFNRFRVLAWLLQRRRSPEANQTLHDVWLSPGWVRYIHFWGLLPHDGILPGANFTLVQVLHSPVLAALLHDTSSGRQPNFAAWYKEWKYRTFTEGATYIRLGGHHVGHRPTF